MPLPFIAGASLLARAIVPASKYFAKSIAKSIARGAKKPKTYAQITAGDVAYESAPHLVKGKKAKAPPRKKKEKESLFK